jgi:hypothetical protein
LANEGYGCSLPTRTTNLPIHFCFPTLNRPNSILLFPEKEAKGVCSASQKTVLHPKLGEADPGGLGACPQETIDFSLLQMANFLLFPEKEAKSVCSASRKTVLHPKFGEADPGGLGACPQKSTHLESNWCSSILLFLVLLRRRRFCAQNSAKPTQGVWGLAPRRLSVYLKNFSIGPRVSILFPKNEAKNSILLRRRVVGQPKLVEPPACVLSPIIIIYNCST